MKKLEELEAAEQSIKNIEAALATYTYLFKLDGTIDAAEQKALDDANAKLVVAKAEAAKKKKEYLALFNDTNLEVYTDKVSLVTKFDVNTNGTKVILTPAKPNGKTIYFFFGYTLNSAKDMGMRDKELAGLEDDVISAAGKGFKVVYDKSGTSGEFEAALYDSTCYGIYWSGHGVNGTIETSDGKTMRASDFDANKVSGKIQFLILATCQSGKGKDDWEKLIKKKSTDAEFQGWVNNTNTTETNDFTEDGGLFDSWESHNGTDPDKELDDYINKAEKAK